MLQFEPITLEKQLEYKRILALTPDKASDYSFINLWGWRNVYGLEWAFDGDLVWIRQNKPEQVFWAPVGNWDILSKRRELMEEGCSFIRVPESLALRMEKETGARANELRSHWDYLYSVEELTELRGNRFHKKKNLLRQFIRKYDFEFNEFTSDCVEEALAMQEAWCEWRDCESDSTLWQENDAIHEVLENWDRLDGVFGGTIRVDGRIIAYCVADGLSEDTLVVHFEKGETSFKGIYQAINQMFLEKMANGYTLVNREQDLGDEGLRKAKLSYNPADFMKKCKVCFG